MSYYITLKIRTLMYFKIRPDNTLISLVIK